MGADAVNIGLNHTLPVDDPRVLAREIAQRLQWNIELGYDSWTKYDEARRLVSETPYIFVELERFVAMSLSLSTDYAFPIISIS